MNRCVLGIVGLLATITLNGCGGGGEEEQFSLVPVKGKVSLDGKPLAGVTISFIADPSNKPSTDGGDITGQDGSFSAKYRNRSGLAPGKYKVAVAKPAAAAGSASKGKLPAEITQSPYMASLASDTASKQGAVKEKPWLYGDAGSTPLSHQVSAKGDTDLDFDLKSSK